jgi:hypothetical protein
MSVKMLTSVQEVQQPLLEVLVQQLPRQQAPDTWRLFAEVLCVSDEMYSRLRQAPGNIWR